MMLLFLHHSFVLLVNNSKCFARGRFRVSIIVIGFGDLEVNQLAQEPPWDYFKIPGNKGGRIKIGGGRGRDCTMCQ